MLSSETEGATIYWTCDPNATDVLADIPGNPAWHVCDGSEVALNRDDASEDEISLNGIPTGRKQITLKAAAFKDGMRPDGVRSYTYVFDSEVRVPKGYDHEYNGAPQIGVRGGSSYTLEAISEGVTVSKNGDVAGTNPGTYTVRAKIREGFRWEIVDPETGETTYTTEDQVITFKIISFNVDSFVITYDLNGGTYQGSSDNIAERHKKGDEIEIHPAPVKDGYTFLYWKESEYQPGEKYTVVDDHVFVAQWKLAEDLSGATVEPAKGKYTYTGKAIKPAVTVTLGGRVLEQGRDYTVKYSKNKNVGTATITVAGRGGYAGRATVAFKIVPKGTKLTSVSGGKESFTAKWKKQAKQVTGYKVQYSTSETFASGNKTVTVPSAKAAGKKIKGLKSKTTYYVRIRAYKTVDGVNYYSGWSEKKSVKTS